MSYPGRVRETEAGKMILPVLQIFFSFPSNIPEVALATDSLLPVFIYATSGVYEDLFLEWAGTIGLPRGT